jgi:peroxiredoxin Q/BCP
MTAEHKAIDIGDPAPDFSLRSHTGEEVSLGDLLGRGYVVLFFYPKDETAGCTKEACAFRDSYARFQRAGAVVVGISSDSVESHRGFAAHHNLPFTLLADEGGKVRKRYGVPKSLGIVPGRVTYVIDRQGVVRHVFSSQLAATQHVPEALDALNRIGQEGHSTQVG